MSYIEIAKETMLGDLMACLVEQLKVCPKPWQQMTETEQQEALDRMELQLSDAIRQVVNIVLSENKIAVQAKIESVTYKDGCKAVLKAIGDIANTIHLAEAEGQFVNIIIPQTDAMLNGDGKPQAEPDQRGLDLGQEYDEDGELENGFEDAPTLDPLQEPEINAIVVGDSVTSALLKRRLKLDTKEQAEEMLERAERTGLVEKADENGVRKVIKEAAAA